MENKTKKHVINWNLSNMLSDKEISEAIHNYLVSGVYLSKKFHREHGKEGLRNYGNKFA